jgi:hypothetical protein
MQESTVRELQDRLRALRPLLVGERANDSRDLFDEFVQECEFELALHAVCDFVLDPASPIVSKPILNQIQTLHALMEIDDDCAEKWKNRKLV